MATESILPYLLAWEFFQSLKTKAGLSSFVNKLSVETLCEELLVLFRNPLKMWIVQSCQVTAQEIVGHKPKVKPQLEVFQINEI